METRFRSEPLGAIGAPIKNARAAIKTHAIRARGVGQSKIGRCGRSPSKRIRPPPCARAHRGGVRESGGARNDAVRQAPEQFRFLPGKRGVSPRNDGWRLGHFARHGRGFARCRAVWHARNSAGWFKHAAAGGAGSEAERGKGGQGPGECHSARCAGLPRRSGQRVAGEGGARTARRTAAAPPSRGRAMEEPAPSPAPAATPKSREQLLREWQEAKRTATGSKENGGVASRTRHAGKSEVREAHSARCRHGRSRGAARRDESPPFARCIAVRHLPHAREDRTKIAGRCACGALTPAAPLCSTRPLPLPHTP